MDAAVQALAASLACRHAVVAVCSRSPGPASKPPTVVECCRASSGGFSGGLDTQLAELVRAVLDRESCQGPATQMLCACNDEQAGLAGNSKPICLGLAGSGGFQVVSTLQTLLWRTSDTPSRAPRLLQVFTCMQASTQDTPQLRHLQPNGHPAAPEAVLAQHETQPACLLQS